MEKLKCIVIDDQPSCCAQLQEYIGDNQGLDFITSFECPEQALVYLYENRYHMPDIIFLDYQMDVFNGDEFIRRMPARKGMRPFIIFTTGHGNMAESLIQDTNVFSFLKKPVTIIPFAKCVDKIRLFIEHSAPQPSVSDADGPLFLQVNFKREKKLYAFEPKDILYIKSDEHYAKIAVYDKSRNIQHHIVRQSLVDIFADLNKKNSYFIMPTRQYILNLKEVKFLQKRVFTMNDGTQIRAHFNANGDNAMSSIKSLLPDA